MTYQHRVFAPASALIIGALLLATVPASATPASGAPAAKKTCTWVKKKVKGTIKRVRVCRPVKPKPTPTTTPQPLRGDDLATQHAARLLAAGTRDARRAALLDLMRTLSIGVYRSDGSAIVRGAERSDRDFYLYDFELTALAGSLERQDRFDLSTLAAFINRLKLGGEDGRPMSQEVLRQALHAGIQDAMASPQRFESFVPLLIRELGLRRSPAVDLAQDLPLSQITFDALQIFLLEADLLVPLVRDATGTSVSVRPLAVVHSLCPAVEPEQPAQLGDKALVWWLGNKIADHLTNWKTWIKTAASALAMASVIVDGIHGSIIAFGLKVSRVSNDFHTHYGPAGHRNAPDGGKPLQFQIQVEMQDDLGAEVINCLALAGIKLPKKGPVPNVPIRWMQLENDLTKHGTMNPAPGLLNNIVGIDGSIDPAAVLGAKTATGGDGIATLRFTPKQEGIAGIGTQIIEHGTLQGVAEWGSAFDNNLGRINQYISPKYDVMGWDVGYHKARGLKFSGATFEYDIKYDEPTPLYPQRGHLRITVSGGSCGQGNWDLQNEGDYVWYYKNGRVTQGKSSAFFTNWLKRTSETTASDETPSYRVSLHLTSLPTPQAELHLTKVNDAGSTFTPNDMTATVPLEEDLGCPAVGP